MLNFKPTKEQVTILETLKKNNVYVISCAGSGKSSSIFYLTQEFAKYGLKLLVLTYNKRLENELREKCKKYNLLKIMKVHTFHSFVNKYYIKCYDDTDLKMALCNNIKPRKTFKFHIIAIDECQDLNEDYFNLVCKIFADNEVKARFCLVGDPKQCIYYKLKNASTEYLENPQNYFPNNGLSWKRCNLSESFRLTPETTSFINYCLHHPYKIISRSPSGPKPIYLYCDENNAEEYIELINECIRKYGPENIFILAPSVRYKDIKDSNEKYKKNGIPPIIKIENELMKRYGKKSNANEKDKIKIYASTNDDVPLDEKVIKDKLVITTYYQVKGLERDCVIVCCFSNCFSKYYRRGEDVKQSSNTMYVACSRARKQLILIHSFSFDLLDYLRSDKLLEFVKLKMTTSAKRHLERIKNKEIIRKNKEIIRNYIITKNKILLPIVSFLRFVSPNIINICYWQLEKKQIRKASKLIEIESIIKQSNYYEEVADINGIFAVKYYQQFKLLNKMPKISDVIKETIYEWTKINQCQFKNHQIQHFDWINESHVSVIVSRLNTLNLGIKYYEKRITTNINKCNISHSEKESLPFVLHGSIDYHDDKKIFEFKFVNDLERIHFIQLALYALITYDKIGTRDLFLYNIKTDELWQIEYNINTFKMIGFMLMGHYLGRPFERLMSDLRHKFKTPLINKL